MIWLMAALVDVSAASVAVQGFDALFRAPIPTPLKGRCALVTGASSGIGKATACMLAQHGADLIVVARREDRLLELKAEVERRGLGSVEVVVGDLTADDVYAKLAACGAYQRADILINNAGLARGRSEVGDASLSDWRAMLEANCVAAFRIVNEHLPHMIERGAGHIVTIGSVAGIEPYEGGSVYAASKHAVQCDEIASR